MAFRGIDLGELWRAREWRKLANLIDHLPRNSFFNEALGNDAELAEALVDQPPGETHERLSNWDETVEMLALVVDRLGLLAVIAAASGGHKGLTIEPVRRPVTELQRARERKEKSRAHVVYRSLVHRLVPRETD